MTDELDAFSITSRIERNELRTQFHLNGDFPLRCYPDELRCTSLIQAQMRRWCSLRVINDGAWGKSVSRTQFVSYTHTTRDCNFVAVHPVSAHSHLAPLTNQWLFTFQWISLECWYFSQEITFFKNLVTDSDNWITIF